MLSGLKNRKWHLTKFLISRYPNSAVIKKILITKFIVTTTFLMFRNN
jgi:hypothetical protein